MIRSSPLVGGEIVSYSHDSCIPFCVLEVSETFSLCDLEDSETFSLCDPDVTYLVASLRCV